MSPGLQGPYYQKAKLLRITFCHLYFSYNPEPVHFTPLSPKRFAHSSSPPPPLKKARGTTTKREKDEYPLYTTTTTLLQHLSFKTYEQLILLLVRSVFLTMLSQNLNQKTNYLSSRSCDISLRVYVFTTNLPYGSVGRDLTLEAELNSRSHLFILLASLVF